MSFSSGPRESNALRANLDDLMVKKEDLKRKRFVLQKKIDVIKVTKADVLKRTEQLKQDAVELEQKIAALVSARDDLDVTLQKTEEAIGRITANTELLLAMVNKSDQNLKSIVEQ